MGVDLYVGPLCRYFARDWLSEASTLLGRATVVVGPRGVIPRENPVRYLDMVRGWKRVVMPALRRGGADGVEWDERIDAPYFTRAYQWSTHNAVRLVAAYAEFPEFVCPDEAPFGDDTEFASFLARDAAMACVAEVGLRGRFAHLHRCLHWLPVRLHAPTSVEWPSGVTVEMGSSLRLRDELIELCRSCWGLSPDEFIGLTPGVSDRPSVHRHAQAGLGALWPACEASVRQRGVMLVDA